MATRGGEASETDSTKKRSGSEREGDDGRRCRQSGGSGGHEEKQAKTDRKQQALERQMAELMARMNPQAISSKASPSAVPATVTPPSISPLRIAVAPMLPNRQSPQQQIVEATIAGRQRLGWMLI